jgi:hypothetical protein
MDNKRLVWAAKGCLWASVAPKDGIQQIRLLHDFNGMQFEPLAAPSETVAAAHWRQCPEGVPSPVRNKLNRSRVHPDDDPNY